MVEIVMPPGHDPSPARSFDLLMPLANEEGRVRTEAEFRDLFAAAALRLARVIPTTSPNFILEGVPPLVLGRHGPADPSHTLSKGHGYW